MSAGRPAVERDGRGRRVCERDRHGTAVATLSWAEHGALAEAALRIPDGSWLRIRPRAADDPRWGATDVVDYDGVARTGFASVDWAAIDAIPPLAEPARLPPGGGTAVLNLIATLAADQHRGPLAYRGPYPTEQLFLALLECFKYESAADQSYGPPAVSPGAAHPLEIFMEGGLLWIPTPHARDFDPRGVCVQRRERVEKLVWRGRAYYRDDWQGVERHATHRVRDDGERVIGSLWALGEPIEDHVVLSRAGDVLETRVPTAGDEPARPLDPVTAAGLLAIVIAGSAPPLAAAIRSVAAPLAFEWAPLSGDLAALDASRARISTTLRRALAARLAAATTRAEQLRVGFAALAEAAHALADGLRARGQAHLAAAGATAQAAALAQSSTDAATAARQIGEAVERLLMETAQPRA